MTLSPFEQLNQDMKAYMRSCVLAALAEFDLGTVLLQNNNSLTALEIAHKIQGDERACEMLLDAIVALEYFTKEGAYYSVVSAYKELLDSTHALSSIAIIRHSACTLRSWARLSWSVKSGKPQEDTPSILGSTQDEVSFIMGMNSLAVQILDSVVNSLEEAKIIPNKENVRILDVGGASGTYTEAFLKRLPHCHVTLFDLPIAIEQAQKRFNGSEFGSRVTLVEGDFDKNDLPLEFDFVWLSAIIHQMNRAESRKLYAKILHSLNPHGIIAIRDFVMDKSRTSPKNGALFGINMLVQTENGMVYTYDEIKEDLENVGFTDVCHAVDTPTMSAIVTAKKLGNKSDGCKLLLEVPE